jgi:hypothetical protein
VVQGHVGPTEAQNRELLKCLKNSGERNERPEWSHRVGQMVPVIYYGGTGIVCSVAARLLVTEL